jgi:2-polyprenyl-6-methoxyphenol hydroxylase-like FAD-dependent oxidoreductase
LHDYLAGRFEDLRPLRFGRADASIYKTAKCVADSFIADGAAIAGDAAHTTNPAGGSGMNLAIVDAETLATEVAPILTAGGSDGELDAALVRYDEVRRPYAHKSISLNDERALAPYKNDAYKDPDAFIGQWSGAQAAGPRPTAPASS